jgi:hypothetical protein
VIRRKNYALIKVWILAIFSSVQGSPKNAMLSEARRDAIASQNNILTLEVLSWKIVYAVPLASTAIIVNNNPCKLTCFLSSLYGELRCATNVHVR